MFTFIIPLFNNEDTIINCVNSILSIQVEKEIFLVDDGSTDSSGILCKQLVTENPCVYYFRKNNGGAASARNVGLEQLKGDYIIFVDGDDYLDNKWYQFISKVINEDADLFVYGMAFDYYHNNQVVRTDYLSNKYLGIKSKADIEDHFSEFFHNNSISSACNKVFRKEIIKKCNIRFNETMTLYEDMDFVLQYLSVINRVYFIPEALYHYRINLDQTHDNNRIDDLNVLKHNLDIIYPSFSRFSNSNKVFSVYSNLFVGTVYLSLLKYKMSRAKMSQTLRGYFDDSHVSYEGLTNNNKRIITLIKNIDFNKLYKLIRFRQLKNNLKKAIKKFVGVK